jgi:MFS family permease
VLAIGLATIFINDIRKVFWIAIIPALIAVAILWLAVREPANVPQGKKRIVELRPRDLPRVFWVLSSVAGFFTLARFSEAFLVLRGANVGLSLAWTPIVLVVMNLVYMLSAYPAGKLADSMSRPKLLSIGCIFLVIGNIVLAKADSPVIALAGVALWGLHMGFTEGIFNAMVADSAPAHLRGTAFGVFNFLRGILLLSASVLAGVLWDVAGPASPFWTAAILAAASLVLLNVVRLNKVVT